MQLAVSAHKTSCPPIHLAFSDAIGWRYIDFNPATHARLPRLGRIAKNRPKPWTVEELAAWLRVAMTDRFAGLWVLVAHRTGVRRIRLHDIRHTYVTLARDHGVDSKVLSDRVGHASETATKQIYTHRSVGYDRDAANELAALIENALKKAV